MLLTLFLWFIAAPFAILWAVCLLGNLWLLVGGLAQRRRGDSPVVALGFLAGLVACVVSPLHAHVDWWRLLALCLLPEAVGALLALANWLLPEPHEEGQRY